MIYKSKKNENVTAKVLETNEKYKTVTLEYLSGEDMGKSFSLSSATLKRWWSLVEDETSEVKSSVNIDNDKINEPYAPKVTPHYIPKPKSVIEYEAKKNKSYNADLPDFDSIVDTIGSKCVKINNNSQYVKFADKSTLWRKASRIDMYVCESLWEKLTNVGLTSSPNKDKDRPFAFKINNSDEYSKVVEVILND